MPRCIIMTKIWLTQNCNTARCRNPFLVQAWKIFKFPFNGKLLFFSCVRAALYFSSEFGCNGGGHIHGQLAHWFHHSVCRQSHCAAILKTEVDFFSFWSPFRSFSFRLSALRRLYTAPKFPLQTLNNPLCSTCRFECVEYDSWWLSAFHAGWWWSVDWACTILAKHCCAWIQIPCHSPCS